MDIRNLLLDVGSRKRQKTYDDCIRNKILKIHQLCIVECGKRRNQKFGSLAEFPSTNAKQGLIDSQTIAPIPIAPKFQDTIKLVKVACITSQPWKYSASQRPCRPKESPKRMAAKAKSSLEPVVGHFSSSWRKRRIEASLSPI